MSTTRTFYLPADNDLTLYNKAKAEAKKVQKSVSSYILTALEEYMDKNSIKLPFVPHLLYLGETGNMEKKMFEGIFLASEIVRKEKSITETHIYLTQKEKILVYTKELNVKENYEKASFIVYDCTDDVVNVSDRLYEQIREKIDMSDMEYLDV